MSEEQLWSIPDDVERIYIHYTTEDLLKGFREEALRHREEIEKLKEQNKMLKEAVKEKVIATCNACEDYGICPHSYREFDLDNIIKELEKDFDNFDVFKEFSFPLMKRWEEEQVKSSIDYEWRKAIKEPFLNKIKELKGSDKE